MRAHCTVTPDPGNSYSYLCSRWRCDAKEHAGKSTSGGISLHPAAGSSGVYTKGREQEEGAKRPDTHELALLLRGPVSGPWSVPLMCEDIEGRGRGGEKRESCAWVLRFGPIAPSVSALRRGGTCTWPLTREEDGGEREGLPEAQEHSGAMRIPGTADTTHSMLRAAGAGIEGLGMLPCTITAA
ncbi:hypothetical protein K438DRAFT_1927038 [Mycena galopus ATCC 62051]|nr:hypothetical protein K438DRAFT_1927038 [Mycena galopus ATCC 62051]